MKRSTGPILDMTRDGEFIDRPKPSLGAIAARLAAFGLLLLVTTIAFWAALFLVPVLLILSVAAYLLASQRMKRAGFVVVRRY